MIETHIGHQTCLPICSCEHKREKLYAKNTRGEKRLIVFCPECMISNKERITKNYAFYIDKKREIWFVYIKFP